MGYPIAATRQDVPDARRRFRFSGGFPSLFAIMALLLGMSPLACGGRAYDDFSTYPKSSSAYSISVSNGDIYVAGSVTFAKGPSEWPVAALWKNPQDDRNDRTPNYLLGQDYASYAVSVFAADAHCYVAGPISNKDGLAAALWTDGSTQYLRGSEKFGALGINSVFVSGQDVYIAGTAQYKRDGGSLTKPVALLWKNGALQPLSTDGDSSDSYSFDGDSSEAYSVYVLGNDVYVAGADGEKAVLWKNGAARHLSDGSRRAAARSVFVSGNDVYVAGIDGPDAVLWKNDVAEPLASDGKRASANSVFVLGADVYVAGADGNKAVLWKNGAAEYLDSDRRGASAHSVFVHGNYAYVVGTDGWRAILWRKDTAAATAAGVEKVLLTDMEEK